MPHLLLFPTVQFLLFLSRLLPHVVSQSPNTACGPNLLALAPCGPFVQGMVPKPVQMCCENLDQLYKHNPSCLCLLLRDTRLASSFPINTTLALQLPLLCNLNIHPSTCLGTSEPALSSPAQVSFGQKPKPGAEGAISSSPIVTVAPRPRFMGFGFHHSAEVRLKAETRWVMLLTAGAFTVLARYTEQKSVT